MVTDSDNHTVLLVLDVPERKSPPTFILMRSRPVKKEIVFIGIPSNSIALVDGNQEGILASYNSGGAASAAEFVEKVFEVEVAAELALFVNVLKYLEIVGAKVHLEGI